MTSTRGGTKHTVKVAGSQVKSGTIESKHMFRLIRNDEILMDNMKIEEIKKFKETVGSVNKGEECGISFKGFDGLEKGDVVECYTEEDYEMKFSFKPGVEYAY